MEAPACKHCGYVPLVINPEGNATKDANGNPVIYFGAITCPCYEPKEVQ